MRLAGGVERWLFGASMTGIPLSSDERLAWLGLAWGAELGPAGFARVLAAHGTALEAIGVSEADLVNGEARLKAHQAAVVPTLPNTLSLYERQAEELVQQGVQVLLSVEAGYPRILKTLPHPPPVVCLRGKLLPIDDLALAIVGTRTPSHEGVDMAGDLAGVAASEDFTIVSGLARGIDTAGHLGALGRDGRTIAVMGNGIMRVHPPENEELAERVVRNGCLVSELPPWAEPTIPNLMARNRLISLFARGVIVVECGSTGGSLATAQAAMQQRRALYVVEWPVEQEKRMGNNQLVHLGGQKLAGPQEMRELCLKLRGKRPVVEAKEEAGKVQMTLF